MPPAAAAAVAVAKPSQSVPGSLMCTCVSTKPGSSTVASGSKICSAAGYSASIGPTARITPSATATATGRISPSITALFGTDNQIHYANLSWK